MVSPSNGLPPPDNDGLSTSRPIYIYIYIMIHKVTKNGKVK